jgi:pimeloyl-ACP methyl ester carboxylesterase
VVLGKGVHGVIAVPHAVDLEDYHERGYTAATNKAALIIHGQGGHRNYCYQKRLAHMLAAELGIYSLRIDFRGCGDSDENEDQEKGRVLSQDIEDIQACAEFLTNGKLNPLGINFMLSSIIAHSRGGVAMFLWAMKQNEIAQSDEVAKAIIVPNLVNCSARFRSYTVLERYDVLDDDVLALPQNCLRYGKMQNVPISRLELFDLATADLTPVSQLPLDWSCLSIYGLYDNIVPIDDSALWANYLSRGPLSHKLRLIPFADHNFYGVHEIEDEDDAETYNQQKLPLTKKKLVNYNYLVCEMIVDWLDPAEERKRFAAASVDIGRFPRWKQIEGVSNFRDIGGWKIYNPTFPDSSNPHNKYFVKPNVAFRCANMTNITKNGLAKLQDLGVKAVFDLRSDGECIRNGVPDGFAEVGIKRYHVPVFTNDDYSPQSVVVKYSNLMTCWSTFVNVYENILILGTTAFKTIFEYIRDDGRPFVFHCTAGKDRTGIFGMLLLLLLGVDKNTIAKEYELTTIGLKPEHPKIKKEFLLTIDNLKNKLDSDLLEFENLISRGRNNWSVEDDGFENLISSKYEAMLATYEAFHNKYGGIVQYLKVHLGFTDKDIKAIYDRLVVLDPQNGGFVTSNHISFEHQSQKPKI